MTGMTARDTTWRSRLYGFLGLMRRMYDQEMRFTHILRQHRVPEHQLERWSKDARWLVGFLDRLHARLLDELRSSLPEVEPDVLTHWHGLRSAGGRVLRPVEIGGELGLSEEQVHAHYRTLIDFLRSADGVRLFERTVLEVARRESNSITPITQRELDLLVAVYDFCSTNDPGELPENQWLEKRLDVTPSGLSNLKKSLREKGYLDERFSQAALTEEAKRLLDSLVYVPPAEIAVLGEVKAGKTRSDEIVVLRDISSIGGEDVDTITVPSVQNVEHVFALQVIGTSMEHERIFAGDYVIVQRLEEDEEPKQGELVIARYLPLYAEEDLDTSEVGWADRIEDRDLEGPTLKRYYRQEDHYRLSWATDLPNSEYTIRTPLVRSLARVIGIYRPVS